MKPMCELHPDVHWSIAIRGVLPLSTQDMQQSIPLFEFHQLDSLKTASIGKLFLLAETMRQVEAGTISLDDVVERKQAPDEDYIEDSGLLYMLRQPTLCIADLGVLIASFSDNYATNLLVDQVGLANVQRCAKQVLGYGTSNLLDKVRMDRDPSHGGPDDMSRGCADELCDYMVRLAQRRLISDAASMQIDRWLAADADTSMLAGVFNVDPLAHWPQDAGFRLRHKTGTESDVRCDVGFVQAVATKTTVAYAVLANWDKHDRGEHGKLRDAVLAQMRRLGVHIRQYLESGGSQGGNAPWA